MTLIALVRADFACAGTVLGYSKVIENITAGGQDAQVSCDRVVHFPHQCDL